MQERLGDISKMKTIVKREYSNFRRGKKNKILLIKDASGANRVIMRLNMFGVEKVESLLRHGSVCTVFPEDNF